MHHEKKNMFHAHQIIWNGTVYKMLSTRQSIGHNQKNYWIHNIQQFQQVLHIIVE